MKEIIYLLLNTHHFVDFFCISPKSVIFWAKKLLICLLVSIQKLVYTLANSSLSFKISLQLFSISLPVHLTSYHDSRLHDTSYYTFIPYFFSYHSKYRIHFPALVFVHLFFFFTRTPTFQIFCHYTAATPLHHILISHSYKLPVHCFLPTASSIFSLSGQGGIGD